MLYQIDNGFVDVVHETPYEGLLTVRASNEDDLKAFTGMTMGEILNVPHHIYQYILHIGKSALEVKLHWKALGNVEVLERLTPEPTAFACDYATENDEGKLVGEYWYCWPGECEEVRDRLMHSEEPVAVEPTFIPIFYLPRELTGAPLPFELTDDSGGNELNSGDEG